MNLLNPYTYSLNDNKINHRVVRNYAADKVGEHRGVEILRQSRSHYLYVVDGIIIAERAGISDDFRGLIDDFKDSTTIHQSTALHAYERMQGALETGRKLIESGEAKL